MPTLTVTGTWTDSNPWVASAQGGGSYDVFDFTGATFETDVNSDSPQYPCYINAALGGSVTILGGHWIGNATETQIRRGIVPEGFYQNQYGINGAGLMVQNGINVTFEKPLLGIKGDMNRRMIDGFRFNTGGNITINKLRNYAGCGDDVTEDDNGTNKTVTFNDCLMMDCYVPISAQGGSGKIYRLNNCLLDLSRWWDSPTEFYSGHLFKDSPGSIIFTDVDIAIPGGVDPLAEHSNYNRVSTFFNRLSQPGALNGTCRFLVINKQDGRGGNIDGPFPGRPAGMVTIQDGSGTAATDIRNARQAELEALITGLPAYPKRSFTMTVNVAS